METVVLVCAVVAMMVGLGLTVAVDLRNQREPMETVDLRFAPDVTDKAVWAVLGCMAGLPTRTRIVLEVVGDSEGVRHLLHAEPGTLGVVRAHVRGVLPGARLETVEPAEPSVWRAAARVRWGGRHPVLRTEQPAETAAALLGALSGLRGKESVSVRWMLRPARGPYLSERESRPLVHTQEPLAWLRLRQPLDAAHLGALRSKYSGPVLFGWAVVAVAAGGQGRNVNLLTRVIALLQAQSGPYGQPVIRRCRSGNVQRFVERVPLSKGSRFSPAELVGLVGWPIDAPRVPGLVLGVAPQLMPSPRIPRKGGRVWGYSTWPGMEDRPLVQPVVGGLSHALVVGPSGVGKSALLASLIAQDVAAGRGCLVVDGKGDLADEVLSLIDERRRGDVIVLDPSREGPVPGLRVFGGGDPELIWRSRPRGLPSDLHRLVGSVL